MGILRTVPRTRTLVLVNVVALLATVPASLWLWARPREHVALPPPGSSPDQVVQAYIEALNARDFATANTLVAGGALPTYGRFDRAPRYTDLRIRYVSGPAHGRGGEQYDVSVSFVYDGNGDVSLDAGPNDWAYVVERHSPAGPWHITAAGLM